MARWYISYAAYDHERLFRVRRNAGTRDNDTKVRRCWERQPRPRSPVY